MTEEQLSPHQLSTKACRELWRSIYPVPQSVPEAGSVMKAILDAAAADVERIAGIPECCTSGLAVAVVSSDGIRRVSPAEYLRSPGDGEATEGALA